MALCKKCNKEIADDLAFCPYCGTSVTEETATKTEVSKDKGSFLWAVLGFFIPIVGLILFILWRKDRPKDAKLVGIGTIIGWVVSFIGGMVGGILLLMFFGLGSAGNVAMGALLLL